MSDIRYAWLVDDEPYSGTLDRYAKDRESGHHGGVNVSNCVWSAGGDGLIKRDVETVFLGTDDNDYMRYRLRVQANGLLNADGDEAYMTIDGRA